MDDTLYIFLTGRRSGKATRMRRATDAALDAGIEVTLVTPEGKQTLTPQDREHATQHAPRTRRGTPKRVVEPTPRLGGARAAEPQGGPQGLDSPNRDNPLHDPHRFESANHPVIGSPWCARCGNGEFHVLHLDAESPTP